MATLTVWPFPATDGAGRAALALDRSSRAGLLEVQDAAVVQWESAERKPRTRHLACGLTVAPLDDGFWGLLFGLVFFRPLLGASMGAATGALTGGLADVGIDDHFMNRVRDRVTPGTSALVVLTAAPLLDRVSALLEDSTPLAPISADLDATQEAALRAVFTD